MITSKQKTINPLNFRQELPNPRSQYVLEIKLPAARLLSFFSHQQSDCQAFCLFLCIFGTFYPILTQPNQLPMTPLFHENVKLKSVLVI